MVAELVDHYRLKELAGQNQGRNSFLDARRVRRPTEWLNGEVRDTT